MRGLDGASAAELARLHAAIAEWAADAVEQLLAAAHAPASAVDFIACTARRCGTSRRW